MDTQPKKVFGTGAISLATFLGGPLAGGFVMAKNFRLFGQPRAALNAVFLGIITTILLFLALLYLPEGIFDKIPNAIIPAIYTGVIGILADRMQGPAIRKLMEEGAVKASNWIAAGYGFIGLVIYGALIAVAIFAVPFAGYPKNMQIDENITLYYSGDVEDMQVLRVSEAIKSSRFMEGSAGADIFLKEEDDFFALTFILPDTSAISDELVVHDFTMLEKYLNYNLNPAKPLEIRFADLELTYEMDLPEIEMEDLGFYEPLGFLENHEINANQHIYYNYCLPLKDVEIIKDAVVRLKNYFPPGQPLDIIVLNNGNNYSIKFFVNGMVWNNPAVIKRIKSAVTYMQDNGINSPMKISFIDPETYREKQI